MAFLQSRDRLARGELGVGMNHRSAAFGLGQQDGVWRGRHDGVEIGVGEAGRNRIDAHQQARAPLASDCRLEEIRRARARLRLAIGRDRVLKIDDHHVGAAHERLVELGAAVGGNEQERAHQTSMVPSVTTMAGPPTVASLSVPLRNVSVSSTRLGRPIS